MRWKADGGLVQRVALELSDVFAHHSRAHDVKSTMALERRESDEKSVLFVCGDLVANALFGFGCGGSDRLASFSSAARASSGKAARYASTVPATALAGSFFLLPMSSRHAAVNLPWRDR